MLQKKSLFKITLLTIALSVCAVLFVLSASFAIETENTTEVLPGEETALPAEESVLPADTEEVAAVEEAAEAAALEETEVVDEATPNADDTDFKIITEKGEIAKKDVDYEFYGNLTIIKSDNVTVTNKSSELSPASQLYIRSDLVSNITLDNVKASVNSMTASSGNAAFATFTESPNFNDITVNVVGECMFESWVFDSKVCYFNTGITFVGANEGASLTFNAKGKVDSLVCIGAGKTSQLNIEGDLCVSCNTTHDTYAIFTENFDINILDNAVLNAWSVNFPVEMTDGDINVKDNAFLSIKSNATPLKLVSTDSSNIHALSFSEKASGDISIDKTSGSSVPVIELYNSNIELNTKGTLTIFNPKYTAFTQDYSAGNFGNKIYLYEGVLNVVGGRNYDNITSNANDNLGALMLVHKEDIVCSDLFSVKGSPVLYDSPENCIYPISMELVSTWWGDRYTTCVNVDGEILTAKTLNFVGLTPEPPAPDPDPVVPGGGEAEINAASTQTGDTVVPFMAICLAMILAVGGITSSRIIRKK